MTRRGRASGAALVRRAASTPSSASSARGNFHVTNAMVAGRRPVRRRPARGRRGDDGRRLRPDERRASAARHRAPGLRADQRDDRDHRGGEEPDAAGRAWPPRRPQPRSNFYVDQAALAAAVGAVPMRVDVAGRRGRGRPRPRSPPRVRRAPHRRCSTCRWTCRRRQAPAGAEPPALPAPTRRRGRRRPTSQRLADALRAARAAGVRRRPRRRGPSAGGAGGAGRPLRRAAGDLGRRQGPVRRQPVVAGRLRRLRLAAGRRADPRRRPDRRLGLRAEHVDDAARPADRPTTPSSSRSTSTPTALGAHRDRRLRRRRRRRATAVAVADALGDRAATGYRTAGAGGARSRERVRWRDVPYDDDGDGGRIDPRTLTHRARRPAARRARRRRRLRQLHGLPEHVPRRARRARLLLHPGVPVDRAGPGHRDRRGAGAARPAAGRRARRRRCADGRRRSWRPSSGWACRWWSSSTTTPPTAPRCTTSGPDGHPLDTVRFPETDFAAIARGYGFEARHRPRPSTTWRAVADWLAGPRDGAAAGRREGRRATSRRGGWRRRSAATERPRASPQLVALELAGAGPRQGVDELDRARVLVRRDRLLDEVLQLLGRPRPGARSGLAGRRTPSRSCRARSSGAPTTAHSTTSGWPSSACSTSGPAML